MVVLFIQVVALATQVKRPENSRTAGSGSKSLIRIWTVAAITPVETAFVSTGHFFRNTWKNYIDLHDARRENLALHKEIDDLRLTQARLRTEAEETHRLQALLAFKERFIGQTVAAQVVGSSGSEQSHVIYIDKGTRDGVKQGMAVITPDGIVGKVKEVSPFGSQVAMINDRDSAAGVVLEKSRLQGIVHGGATGELVVSHIMSDEQVPIGEQVVTSGGDRIYPKGLAVGQVTSAGPDHDNDPFLRITVRPAADLRRLEEVLVVTKMEEMSPAAPAGATAIKAADILAERLPSVPKKELPAAKSPTGTTPQTDQSKRPPDASSPVKKQVKPVAPATTPAGATPQR